MNLEPSSPRPSVRPPLVRLFVSPEEPRARAGWRLLSQGAMAFYFVACCSLPLIFVPGILTEGAITMEAMLGSAAAGAIGITAASYLARGFLYRRPFRSAGFTFDRL